MGAHPLAAWGDTPDEASPATDAAIITDAVAARNPRGRARRTGAAVGGTTAESSIATPALVSWLFS